MILQHFYTNSSDYVVVWTYYASFETLGSSLATSSCRDFNKVCLDSMKFILMFQVYSDVELSYFFHAKFCTLDINIKNKLIGLIVS